MASPRCDAPVPWSAPATTRRVLDLLQNLDWTTARVADIGAGSGHFSHLVGDLLTARDLTPSEHLCACDLIPESFEYDGIPCTAMPASGALPYPDDSFDAVVSIEVIEHVENQFAFMRELTRIAKPGGGVIVTTPNTLNVNSRLRTLFQGFPLLFDPIPIHGHDPRTLAGHIHPIHPYYLAYTALRAGLRDLSFHPDRTKKSGVLYTTLLWPGFAVGRFFHRRRLRRKEPEVLWDENRSILDAQASWALLTCRTSVLRGYKSAAEATR
jgi:SAM-dependent methyltransferase